MKRIASALIAMAIVFATPGIALAWTSIMEHHGVRHVHGQTSETNYPRVRFYAGATQSGTTTYFRVAFRVRCQGGYDYVNGGSVHDFPFRYWAVVVHIPSPATQGRCTVQIAVRSISPPQTNMTIGVSVP